MRGWRDVGGADCRPARSAPPARPCSIAALDHLGGEARAARHLDLVRERRLDQQADQRLVLQQRAGGDDRPGDLDVVVGQRLDQPRRRPLGARQPLGQPRADVALGLADQRQEQRLDLRPPRRAPARRAAPRRGRRGAPAAARDRADRGAGPAPAAVRPRRRSSRALAPSPSESRSEATGWAPWRPSTSTEAADAPVGARALTQLREGRLFGAIIWTDREKPPWPTDRWRARSR